MSLSTLASVKCFRFCQKKKKKKWRNKGIDNAFQIVDFKDLKICFSAVVFIVFSLIMSKHCPIWFIQM